MNLVIKYSLLTLLLAFISPNAMSQVRRVGACNPMSPNGSPYTMVYDYDVVDVQPQFPGGERGLTNFINQTREYPYNAYKRKIEGRVLCSFIVNADGSISHVKILKGVEHTLNREAERIILSMPSWIAGRVNDEPVPVRCILPIAFRL